MIDHLSASHSGTGRQLWNKGKLVGWDPQLSLGECLSIDVCVWKAKGLSANGRSFYWSWPLLRQARGRSSGAFRG